MLHRKLKNIYAGHLLPVLKGVACQLGSAKPFRMTSVPISWFPEKVLQIQLVKRTYSIFFSGTVGLSLFVKITLFLTVLDLCCYVGLSLTPCVEQGLLFFAVAGLSL